jgi:hypothetical protein
MPGNPATVSGLTIEKQNELKDRMLEQPVKNCRRLSLRRLTALAGACLGALVLAGAVIILVFGGAILNSYGKSKAERALVKAHPGSVLRIGELHYSLGANRLIDVGRSMVPAF